MKTLLISGLFVAVQAFSAHAAPSLCNGPANGVIDGDEQCETGPCCTNKCELRSAETVCRASSDETCDPAEVCGEQQPAVDAVCPEDAVAADGTSCEDGEFCTAGDVCAEGACTGGTAPACDDSNPCTADACLENRDLCTHEAADDGTACDDANACTTGDTCSEGECVGGDQVTCSDDNECTDDSCDAASGECVFTNNTASCEDGLFCTDDDVCSEGACTAGPATSCDDGNVCSTDSCNEETDECSHGNAENGTTCDDGQFCTLDDVCTDGVCTGGGANTCDDGNECTADSCHEPSDSCRTTTGDLDGTACDDESACTTDDTCSDGVCAGTSTVVCNDDNLCTDDACDAATGECAFVPNTIPCNDGQFCTAGDRCSEGQCTSGTGNGCDDNDPCTGDSCNEETDSCTYGNAENGIACDDGQFCTLDDTCTDGVCVGGAPRTCDDEIQCTKDSCNEGSDKCQNSPANNNEPCEDGSYCTVNDGCHAGECTGEPRDCADENVCTTDTCNEATDSCENNNNTEPCDDGLFCTTGDTCSGGTCSVNTPTCNDANVCTDDSCNEEADSCSNVNNTDPCEDGLFCTDSDVCAGGVCTAGPARDCADTNECTTDSCNEGTDVCDNVNNTDPCDDGLFCTVTDTCTNGACQGAPKDCGDGNVCTTDTCDDTADACVNTNNTDPCDDGLFCTDPDICSNGACVSGAARTCDDSDTCSDDSCDEAANACLNVPNDTTTCDDGQFCTVGDACVAGSCTGTARDCADTNECTTDSCDDAADACVNANNANPCDDGQFCTVNDACADGACTGSARDCADGNVCTSDICNETTDGCENPNNTAPCEDGEFCTVGDVCADGQCTAGGANDCDDSNVCTEDSCDEAGNACNNVEIPECVVTTTTTLEPDDCGDANGDGELTATDARIVLQAAVGIVNQCTLFICDFNGSGEITAVDALAVLRAAVGLPSNPNCPDADTTSTTTSTTSTTLIEP